MPDHKLPSEPTNRNQNEPLDGKEEPGDTDAPDIVGRTGEEMPEVAPDDVGEEGKNDKASE